jgi:hypothetical protein
VTTGSQNSHGSAQLNDGALLAFSNPFEINLIFIYLQSPSLQVLTQEDESHTANRCLMLCYASTPPWPGEMTKTPEPLSQMVSPAPAFPSGLSQAAFHFSPCAVRVDYQPIIKIHPSQPMSEIMCKSLGFCLEVIWSPANCSSLVGKFKELHPYDFNEATI